MMANAALLAALTTFLLAGWLAGELTFLVPYKAAIFRNYGLHIGLATLLVFFNLSSAFYMVGRWLFLRESGRKLTHVDRQLDSASAIHQDFRHHLQSKRR
jgi:hypothetical protein